MTAIYLYAAPDLSGNTGLWETNGTAAGTVEILPGTQGTHNLFPGGFTVLGNKVLFEGPTPVYLPPPFG